MATLVYLHGVGGLRPGWAEELITHETPDSLRVVAPSFASILADVDIQGRDMPVPIDGEEPVARAVSDADRAAYRDRQGELAARVAQYRDVVPMGLGWPAILPRPTQWPIMGVLDSPARFIGGLDQARRYVRDPILRRRVLDHVRTHVEPALGGTDGRGPVVLVGHSLGALVALDLFADIDLPVDLLVTLGAPLGHPDIAARLVDRGRDLSRLGAWANVVHLLDPVPIGRGARDLFPEAVDVFLPVLAGGHGLTGLIQGVARAATAHLDSTYLASTAVRDLIHQAFTRPAGGLWSTPQDRTVASMG